MMTFSERSPPQEEPAGSGIKIEEVKGIRSERLGTSLVVSREDLVLSCRGAWVRSLGRELDPTSRN